MAGLADLMFEEDLEALAGDQQASRWSIERKPGLILEVGVSPGSALHEEFLVRLAWSDYPGRLPASVIFLNPATGTKGEARFWPNIPGVRPPNDICACWTAEGFAAHPEWLSDSNMAWDPGDNAILTQLRYLQLVLDHHFQGRCQ